MTRRIDTDAEIDAVRFKDQGAPPATPDAGYNKLFSVAGELYYRDDAGTVIGPLGEGGYTEGAHVSNNANISIPDGMGPPTSLTFNSEFWDTDDNHSTVANTERLTCNTDGVYSMGCNVEFAGHAVGVRAIYILVYGYYPILAGLQDGSVNGNIFNLSGALLMYDGMFITCVVIQNSGGALNVLTAALYSPTFWMQRIG